MRLVMLRLQAIWSDLMQICPCSSSHFYSRAKILQRNLRIITSLSLWKCDYFSNSICISITSFSLYIIHKILIIVSQLLCFKLKNKKYIYFNLFFQSSQNRTIHNFRIVYLNISYATYLKSSSLLHCRGQLHRYLITLTSIIFSKVKRCTNIHA